MATELEEKLRATSDEMLRVLDQLRALEAEKRSAAPGTTRFRNLTQEIERLASGIFSHARRQTEIGSLTVEANDAVGQQPTPIEEVPPRDMATILSEWRDAERRLADAMPGSAEAIKAHVDAQRLRAEYRSAHEQGSTQPD